MNKKILNNDFSIYNNSIISDNYNKIGQKTYIRDSIINQIEKSRIVTNNVFENNTIDDNNISKINISKITYNYEDFKLNKYFSSNLDKFPQKLFIKELKIYFNVNFKYLMNKIFFILFPIFCKPNNNEYYKLDLYIPLISLMYLLFINNYVFSYTLIQTLKYFISFVFLEACLIYLIMYLSIKYININFLELIIWISYKFLTILMLSIIFSIVSNYYIINIIKLIFSLNFSIFIVF